MKTPTKSDVKKYLVRYDPLGLREGQVLRNLTLTNANNHWNWLVDGGGKHYVVRIAKPHGNVPANIAIEYATLRYLENSNLAPRPYWLDQVNFMYPLLIEDFIAGKNPRGKPSTQNLKVIARTLAKLHGLNIPLNIPLEDRGYGTRFAILEERLNCAIQKQLPWEIADQCNVFALLPRIKKFFRFAASRADRRRRVFLHGDLYLGNIIIAKGGGATLIDFQKPAIGDPTFDFGNIFVDINWRSYYDSFRDIFIKEYLRHNHYPRLAELFDIRMIERDITSIFSEFRDAAEKFPRDKMVPGKYFAHKHPERRIKLIERGLDQFGI